MDGNSKNLYRCNSSFLKVRDLADPDERNPGRHLCGVTVPGAPGVHRGYRSSSEVSKNIYIGDGNNDAMTGVFFQMDHTFDHHPRRVHDRNISF